VKDMPNAHNGYLDTMLEMGYVGFFLLVAFIATTLHAVGRMADRHFLRAWLVMSLALHIVITNGLESVWMRGFEMLWIVFLMLAAEAGRHWQPGWSAGAALGPRRPPRLRDAGRARLAVRGAAAAAPGSSVA
jgi:O-antigen ligase